MFMYALQRGQLLPQHGALLHLPHIIRLPALMKGAKENVYVGGDHALASQRLLFAQASL